MKTLAVFTGLLCALMTGSSLAHDIIRHSSPGTPVASSVSVPAGSDLLFISGTFADVADPSAPAGSIERFGDTEAQIRSVLGKLANELAGAGYSIADIVKMNVFLVGDPRKGGEMDFDGLMKAFLQFHGLAIRSQNHPARTTVQVASLPIPGALVAIEAVAARHAAH